MADSLIGLGSNLGDRHAMIAATIRQLQEHPDLRVVAVSRLHETRAVGGRGAQPAFLNAAARVETTMSPEQLLTVLQQVEERFGRERLQRWDARTIDLDLLLYGQHILETAELVLPHPRMAFRRFVLEPAVEVAADMVHPATGWTVAQLLNHLNTAFAYVALVGLPGAGKTRLARQGLAADRLPPGDSVFARGSAGGVPCGSVWPGVGNAARIPPSQSQTIESVSSVAAGRPPRHQRLLVGPDARLQPPLAARSGLGGFRALLA